MPDRPIVLRFLQPVRLTLAALLAAACVHAPAFSAEGDRPPELPELSAPWIWLAQPDAGPVYNQTIVARKPFDLATPVRGTLRISADSFYRLSINGRWVADGPCRAWPEHYQYDVLDVTPYLQSGANAIEVIARYFGVGDFHKVPQQPGLIAQLDVVLADGQTQSFVTDSSWQAAEARAWIAATPKVSIQMEPFEWYDARLADSLEFAPARVICATHAGPWKDLNPRDVALLTREPFAFRRYGGATVVRSEALDFCLPAVRLMHPGLIEANHNASAPCGMATVLECDDACTLRLQLDGFKLAIDGRATRAGEVRLEKGRHLLLAMVQTVIGHNKEKSLRFLDPQGFRLVNPLDPGQENPWCFLPLPKYAFAKSDLVFAWFPGDDPEVTEQVQAYQAESDRILREVTSPQQYAEQLGQASRQLPPDAMFVKDCAWQFFNRQVVGDGAALVHEPAAMIHDTARSTVVDPAPEGDVELMVDLGEQNCGYWTFDLVAPAGTTVDIFAVEYIAPDGRIQFSHGNRNGLRYVTREGVNRFTSLKRRSGRYVFLTLRGQSGPVAIRHFGLIESTYPVDAVGSFASSDARLDRIWEISTRTLKLCMEDTFTDCPLYEQTHWVGDARNEALLAYPVFGANDLGQRCIRITGQSLQRYPFAGCQTPSGWDVLLPAWSFLWGISAWDNYWYTGDKEFLREVYPELIRNLRGAEKFVRDDGLFAGPFWNMFDWTPIDQHHHAVLHNSMFMIGAIDAAQRSAQAIGETADRAWLDALRGRLAAGVNRLWNAEKGAYPDSVHDDGSVSGSTSQHTCFLSILYDVAEPQNVPGLTRHLTDPPEKMVRIGSPFAVLYLYEALEKLGMEDRIVEEIYKNYLPMLEAGATTVWESFPTGTTGSRGFPTRSHTHAWSSAPSYFLNRIVLGIKPVAPGGAKLEISPRLSGLTWARGTVATVRGPVSTTWRLEDGDVLRLDASAPEGTELHFVRNASHAGKKVYFNGELQP